MTYGYNITGISDKKIESENYKKNRTGTAMLPVKWESLREKSVKNLIQNLSRIIELETLTLKLTLTLTLTLILK